MAITLMLFDMHIPGFGLEQSALAMGQNIGTGLGLAIVKNIALQYGGSATAMPTPGGGLTIEVVVRGE